MIQIRNLSKAYGDAPGAPHALDDVSLDIANGDVMGVIGTSGAGKSTLVRCINLLERPTSGQILVDGSDVCGLSGAALRAYRRRVAMIFQGFGLLAQRSALDNVCFPFLAAAGRVTGRDRARALELLDRVDLADRADSYPGQLSGGQQQRVAIARALACDPDYILCDEATSALDPASTNTVLRLLRDINRETGVTVIAITHSMDVVEKVCRHVAVLERGRVVESGAASDVLSTPRTDAARALVEGDGWND